VTIVGAGIAGLTTAVAFARRGFPVTVLERAPALAEVGAGIQISPNGLAVLRGLGLEGAAREAGLQAEAVELRRAEDDRLVVRMDVAPRPWLFLHRARLLDVLHGAVRAAGVTIETGTQVEGIAEANGSVELRLTAGRLRAAPFVVGADGLRGRLRAAVAGAAEARFTGQVAWRAVVEGDGPAVAEVHMAPGRHVVTYPLRGGLRNVVAVEERRSWLAEGWSTPGDPAELQRRFAGVSPRLADLLAAVRETHVWGLHRHAVPRRWHGCRIALVGDCVHPTLPFLAQGANLALEDAWALAEEVAARPLAEALPAYAARRRARAARVVAAAGRNARVYHMRGGPPRQVLHTGLRLVERYWPGGALGRLAWVHDHDETRGASASATSATG
jgi:salicylate hydroxylase